MGCSSSNALPPPPLALVPPSQPNPVLTETYSISRKHKRKPRRTCRSEGHRTSTVLSNQPPILVDQSDSEDDPGLQDIARPADDMQLQHALASEPQPGSKLDLGLLAAPGGLSSLQRRGSVQVQGTSDTSLPRILSNQELWLPDQLGQVEPNASRLHLRFPAQLRAAPKLESAISSGEFVKYESLIQRRTPLCRADHHPAFAAAPRAFLQTQQETLQAGSELLA